MLEGSKIIGLQDFVLLLLLGRGAVTARGPVKAR